MPVVNLPQDTRWGDLGKALGQAGGGLLTAIQTANVDKGVSDILSDPSISDNDKGVQALKKFGDLGYKKYQDTVATQAKQAQIKELLAHTGLLTVQQLQATKNLGYSDDEFAAKLGKQKAETANIQSETQQRQALLPGQLTAQGDVSAERQAGTAKTVAETGLVPYRADQLAGQTTLSGAGAAKDSAETALINLKIDQLKRFQSLQQQGVSGDASIDALAKTMGIEPESPIVAAAKAHLKNDPDPAKGQQNAINELTKHVTAVEQEKSRARATENAATIRANEPKALPEAEVKEAASQAQFVTSTKRFLDAVKDDPDKFGLLTGAPIKAAMERVGIGTGDSPLLNAIEAQRQIVANQATSGGGFFAAGRVALAKEIAPNISHSPMANIIAMDTIADREIASLSTRIDAYPKNVLTKPLKDQLAQWQEVKKTTGSLQAYDTPDKKVVALFNGNQVDPKTFKPIMKGDESFDVGGGYTLQAGDLFGRARQAKISPQQALTQIRAQYGYK